MMAMLDQLTAISDRGGHAHPVFGEPIVMGHQTIVPVSVCVISFGAGVGGIPWLSGGGGGGEIRVVPIGFLAEREDEISFTPIALPEGLVSRPRAPRDSKPRPGLLARLRGLITTPHGL